MLTRLLVFSSRVLLGMMVLATTASAQRGVDRAGALFLLLPLGARNAGSGQSVATPDSSAEALYWNPASIARAKQREIGFHHGKFFVGPLNAFALIWPFARAGVIAGGVSVLDYGAQEAVEQGTTIGTFSQHAYVFSATYSATLGPRASLGFSFKNARYVGTCSGLCGPSTTFDVSSSAVDAGIQLNVLGDRDLLIGFALRHAGPKFQVNDEAQADPLPTRVQAGVNYRVRVFDDRFPGAVLRVTADVIDRAQAPGDMAPRFGIDATWMRQLSVRAGYVAGSGEGTGVAAGVGFATGRVAIDVAQTLGASAAATGTGSTFFSIRARW